MRLLGKRVSDNKLGGFVLTVELTVALLAVEDHCVVFGVVRRSDNVFIRHLRASVLLIVIFIPFLLLHGSAQNVQRPIIKGFAPSQVTACQ